PFQRPSRLRARRGTSKHDEHADPDSSRRDNLVMSARFPLGGAGEEDWLAVAEEAFRLPSPPPPPSPHGPPFLSVKPGSRPSDTGGGSEGHSTFTVSTAGVDTSCERTAHEMR
ncbi:unnamed protein product, partial [Sphacelaria rigidula]